MAWITDHCPVAYRFLFQCIGAETKEKAFQEVWRIFHRTDGFFVKGVYLPVNRNSHTSEEWQFRKDAGYMAFVPGKNNSTMEACQQRRVGVKP